MPLAPKRTDTKVCKCKPLKMLNWFTSPGTRISGVRGSPQNGLNSHDSHRDAAATFVFFLSVAATFVFFLAANCVSFLALLGYCT